jgi:hypothetical protein
MREEAYRAPIQFERAALSLCIYRALVPHRVRSTQKLEGAVVREDRVRPCGHGYEERVGLEMLGRDPRGINRVYPSGDEGEPPAFEVMLQPLDGASAAAGWMQRLGGLGEREYRMRSRKFCSREFTFHALTGENFPCSDIVHQVQICLQGDFPRQLAKPADAVRPPHLAT